MNTLRKPFLFIAVFIWVLILGIDLGTNFIDLKSLSSKGANIGSIAAELDIDTSGETFQAAQKLSGSEKPPGWGLSSLALIDALFLFILFWICQALLLPQRKVIKLQGIITLIFSILLIFACIGVIFGALAQLMLMIGLFLAVPFGTLTYIAIFGFFAKSSAAALLGLGMSLRLGFAVCLTLAQQSFLKNRSLVVLYLCCLLCPFIVNFLHAIVPGILVSITDALAAIIVAVIALIWALFTLIGSITSMVKVVKSLPSEA